MELVHLKQFPAKIWCNTFQSEMNICKENILYESKEWAQSSMNT
uniref:Uncharacterized protein n=1 Tax=Rhizophora mucronata TaxID=61149 RepID=A0A2P2NRY4_RHIMU